MALPGPWFQLILGGGTLRVWGVAVVLFLILVGCDTGNNPTEAPEQPQLQGVTLRQLYEEAVANLARYDHEYKGNWFLVTGTVSHMFDYQVVVNEAGESTVHAVLTDLPRSDQIPLNNGYGIAARCQVGEVIGYGVYMENCSIQPSATDAMIPEQTPPIKGDSDIGKEIAVNQGCVACHSWDGTEIVGPTWKGLFGTVRQLEYGSSQIADEAYIRESIGHTDLKIEASYSADPIPVFDLTEEEISHIIAFIKSLQ